MPVGLWSDRARYALEHLRLSRVRAKPFRCPLCGPSLLVQFDEDEIAIRCVRCGATPIAMSVAAVMTSRVSRLHEATVYELSARGPLHRFLQRNAASLVSSQYVEGAAPGSRVSGVRVEDVQCLTFSACTFDVCTSTEVFEHVPDDRRAFAEIRRVLKPGGLLIFTVPITLDKNTRERAALVHGEVVHFVPPEYHHDPAAEHASVLAFRNYGMDIVARLNEAGFSEAEIIDTREVSWFGYRRPVMLARK